MTKCKNKFLFVSNPLKCIANLITQPMHFKMNLEIYQTQKVMKEVLMRIPNKPNDYPTVRKRDKIFHHERKVEHLLTINILFIINFQTIVEEIK